MPKDGNNIPDEMHAHLCLMTEAEADWLDNLDRLGIYADVETLTEHLKKAPNKQSPDALYLAAQLSGQTVH